MEGLVVCAGLHGLADSLAPVSTNGTDDPTLIAAMALPDDRCNVGLPCPCMTKLTPQDSDGCPASVPLTQARRRVRCFAQQVFICFPGSALRSRPTLGQRRCIVRCGSTASASITLVHCRLLSVARQLVIWATCGARGTAPIAE